MRSINAPIITKITRVGQPYIDEPIYITHEPKKDLVSPLARSLAEIYRYKLQDPVKELVGYQMVRLNWKRPDKNGNLVPRDK